MAVVMPPTRLDGSTSLGAVDLLAEYDQMAIPHFQRGLVWGQSSVALLLESLYFGTPCGSIILWTPDDVSEYGEPLSAKRPRYLIVDGQQRIRSLRSVFAATTADVASSEAVDDGAADPADDDQETNRSDVWCLNLAKVPEFQDEGAFAAARRFRLFRRVNDPRFQPPDVGPAATGALKQEREALIPLDWLLDVIESDHQIQLLDDPANRMVKAAAERVLATPAVLDRLCKMRGIPVFHVSILDNSRELADVVSVYSRINTSGRRVEAEERAFASLVAACPQTNDFLRKFFEAVHPERTESQDDGLVRDQLEKRERENKFGFKLFMRVFTIVFAYHCDRVRSTDLAFDAINADTLEKAADKLPKMLASTVDILRQLAKVVRDGSLYCDDLRFLPDSSSLWPLVQLMAAFPALVTADPTTLEPVAFSLVLADLPRRDIIGLVRLVSQSISSNAALEVIERRTATNRIKKKIREGIAEQSLMGRYTLVLYWLLRTRHARDFSPRQPSLDDSSCPTNVLLASDVKAQKQHIVPYGDLKRIFGLDGPRLTKHPANDIGNITYISACQNSFLDGLGSRPISLEVEPDANLRSHFLDDAVVKREFLATIRNCDAGNLKQARLSYSRFTKRRAHHIEDALVDWLERSHRRWPTGVSKATPTRRLVKPREEEVLYDFNYPADIRERLVELAGSGHVSPARADGRVSISLRAKGSRATALRIDVWDDGSKLAVKVRTDNLRSSIVRSFPDLTDVAEVKRKNSKVVVAKQDQMISLLDWVARRKLKS